MDQCITLTHDISATVILPNQYSDNLIARAHKSVITHEYRLLSYGIRVVVISQKYKNNDQNPRKRLNNLKLHTR